MSAEEAAPGWVRAAWVPFGAFALTYFVSALLRAVTATLAPDFSREFGLGAADLGLLAGAYFLGFSVLQLPLGSALDRWGPRRVEIGLVVLAILGCMAFALAQSFAQLVVARTLIGMGVSACLMAPLTYFRRHLPSGQQLRFNAWMLMSGSMGMVASTLPVQWLLPLWGWRGLFALAAAALLVMLPLLALALVRDAPVPRQAGRDARYRDVLRHPVFVRLAPMGMVLYGGLIAMQALWIGPWLTQVCGWTPVAASGGLFAVNSGMLVAFLLWGWLMPAFQRRGADVGRMLAWGVPANLMLLAVVVALGPGAGAVHWLLWCVSASVVSLAQPYVAQAFPIHMAGRALSAFNLAIFSGVFLLQWAIGVVVDFLLATGWSTVDSFRAAIGGFGGLAALTYVWFLCAPHGADNRADKAIR